jgi:hypothetical protein
LPTAEQITTALADLSQRWWLLAVWWHAYLIAFAAALILKWRPSKRLAGLLLTIPLISVVSMSWLSGNPFTTLLLGLVSIAAVVIASRSPNEAVSLATTPLALAGTAMLVFGLAYPHFLGGVSLVTYLYAAPVGIVPCPTLSVLVGLSLILRSWESRAWGLLIGSTAFFYGIVGALYLGVTIDWALSAGAVVLVASSCSPSREGVPPKFAA